MSMPTVPPRDFRSGSTHNHDGKKEEDLPGSQNDRASLSHSKNAYPEPPSMRYHTDNSGYYLPPTDPKTLSAYQPPVQQPSGHQMPLLYDDIRFPPMVNDTPSYDCSSNYGCSARALSVGSPLPQQNYPARNSPVQGYSVQRRGASFQPTQQSTSSSYDEQQSPGLESSQNTLDTASKHKRNCGSSTVTCLYPNCSFTSLHVSDWHRHYKARHVPEHLRPVFSCPYVGCKYAGAHGFQRKDKLRYHYRRVHESENAIGSSKSDESTTNILVDPMNVERAGLTEKGNEKIKSMGTLARPRTLGSMAEAVVPLGSHHPLKMDGPPSDQQIGLEASIADENMEDFDFSPYLEVPNEVFVGPFQQQDVWRSGDTGMDSYEYEWNPRPDDDSMLERSEGSILNGPEVPLECKDGDAPGMSFDVDQTITASTSKCPKDCNLASLEYRILAAFHTREAGQYNALLKFEWDLLAFMKDQFRDNEKPNTVLGSVVTITGSVQHAQATTCAEYVRQNWPAHGLEVLETLQDALDSPKHTSQASIDASSVGNSISGDTSLSSRAELHFDVSHDDVFVIIRSRSLTVIVSAISQLAWMGTALRISADGRVQYCEPKLDETSMAKAAGPVVFDVTFEMSSPGDRDQSCWLPLFSNPVIARGFPILGRENGEQGMEVPLEIMAALGGARHVTEFEGGLVLKGHSAMFVPIRRFDQSIQWHLIRRYDEQRMLYQDVRKCASRAMLDEVDHATLENTRAFLGWWKSAETYLGTAVSAYGSIDWSPAGEARRSARMAGANLGFSTMLTGQISFALGAKDGKMHFSQKGPFQRIVQCAEKMPVALYDTADRRAWFVPALDIMLHIVQTRHHLTPYEVGGKAVELTPAIPRKGRAAALEAIAANQQRQLYERDIATQRIYYFQDAILDIWSQMERLMEKEDTVEACAGLALHGTMQDKLCGWEFMSLVHQRNYRRKEATIAKSSGGWVDLINDIDCLVLFATGLHEIIKPVSDLSKLCLAWRTLPKGKDFLAAGIPIMELLYSEAGSRLSREHLSTSHLQWHRGPVLFECCSGDTSQRCKCDRTQQVYHHSLFKTFGHVQAPGTLEAEGCVVFGQTHHSFKLHKSKPRRQNPVHMLPNTPIEDCRDNNQNFRKANRLSPLPPLSISPEPEGVNGYANPKANRSPSPASLTDDLVHNSNVSPNKRWKVPDVHHIQFPELDICEGYGSCDDEMSSFEEHEPFPAPHHSTPKADRLPKRPEVSSTQTVYASQHEHKSPHVHNNVRRQINIGQCSHLYGCSCTACVFMDYHPPRSYRFG